MGANKLSEEIEAAIGKMKDRGFQAWCARKMRVNRSAVNMIFHGRRLCTPKQAAALEQLFIQKGIPLNRWDLLYGLENEQGIMGLADYLATKGNTEV